MSDPIAELIERIEEIYLSDDQMALSDEDKAKNYNMVISDLGVAVGALKAYHHLIRCAPIDLNRDRCRQKSASLGERHSSNTGHLQIMSSAPCSLP